MKKLCIFLFLSVSVVKAQVPLAVSYFKEAEIAGQNQKLWKETVYGPMLFVDQESRVAYANVPDSAGILKPEDGIYTGLLPKEISVANTAIRWGGQTWSVILWPLPFDRNERVNLLMHESFHRIQEKIGFPAHSPTADHLSTMEGRIYFLLELQALKAALEKPVRLRKADLSNALAFREKRRRLFPKTFGNERTLEMNEGLAEYTGATLGRTEADLRPHLYRQIDTAGERKSLIRSCAYLTGPVYGLLLNEIAPGWTFKIDSTSDLPQLIFHYYHVFPAKKPNENNYDGAAIRVSEKAKEEKRLQAAAAYTKTFTEEPVLTMTLIKMNVVFNPNNLFDLGEYGTVYPTSEVKDIWGHLKVTGGMLLKNWHTVTVSLKGIVLPAQNRIITGNGWTLTLAEHWNIVKKDELHYELRLE